MTVVGIDPGGSGALFELVFDPQTGWSPGESLHMPMVEVGKRIKDLDVGAVYDWLTARPVRPTLLAIEEVGYMPGGEGKSGFAGGGFSSAILSARVYQLIGMLKTMRTIPYETTKPQQWQAALGVKIVKTKGETSAARKKKIKAAIIAYVTRRFPTAKLIPDGCRVVDDGLSDALAIAAWATMQVAKTNPMPNLTA